VNRDHETDKVVGLTLEVRAIDAAEAVAID
jgi:hypothetical protein